MTYSEQGYHGTRLDIAKQIIRESFCISRGDDHWLGDGVYFFANDSQMATEWAISEGIKRKYSKYGVVESSISVQKTALLDLTTDEGQKLFHGLRDIIIKRIESTPFSVKVKGKTFLDGKILNDLCRVFPYKAICSKFFIANTADRRLSLRSGIPNCTVICIRDVGTCINSSRIFSEGDVR